MAREPITLTFLRALSHALPRLLPGSRQREAPVRARLAPPDPGGTLGTLESSVVGRTEASRIPVGLPDFKSGVRL